MVSSNLRQFLGLHIPEALSAEVISSVDEGDYFRRHLTYEGDDGAVIPAFLLEPKQRTTRGGVVVYHQHNSEFHLGKSEVAGLLGDTRQAFGPALAKRGIVVLAPDAVSFEDRRSNARGTIPAEGDWLQHYNAMAYRLQHGDTLMRKCLDDAQRAVSVLLALLEPDARVGVAGHSFGGALSMYHAAVDERCQFACVSGAVCSYAKRQAAGTGISMMEAVPGIAQHFEVRDMIASIQPRPLLVVASSNDPYAADADRVLCEAGASQSTTHFNVPGDHALDDERFTTIVQWLVDQTVEHSTPPSI